MYLDPLPGLEHKFTIILLHGFGQNSFGLLKQFLYASPDFFGHEEIDNKYEVFKHCRIVFQVSGVINETCMGDKPMMAWFNHYTGLLKEHEYE